MMKRQKTKLHRAVCGSGALGLAIAGTVMVAPQAHAVTCSYSLYVSYSSDYARTTDVSGGCATVGARHLYDPIWSSNNYWTPWYYGADVAQTPSTAELISGQATGW